MASSQKRKLRKDDLRTFYRLVVLAKPYWWKLLIGAVASALGGGSIIAMFFSAQHLLGYFMGDGSRGDIGAPAEVVVRAEVAEALPPQGVVESAEIASPEASVAEFIGKSAAEKDESANMVNSSAQGDTLQIRSYVQRMTSKYAEKFLDEKTMKNLENAGVPLLVEMCVGLLIVVAINAICQFVSMFYLKWVGEKVVMDLRVRIFAHLQKLSISFYNSTRAGDMISRTVADTQLLQTTVSNVITDAVREPLKVVMLLAYVIVLEWELAIVAMVLFPIVIVPILIIGRKLRSISHEGQRRLADLTSVMKESLDGVSVVKAYGQESHEEERFGKLCHAFFRQMVRATKAKCINDPLTHTIGGIGGMGVLIYAVVHKMPIGECVIFACAIFLLYDPIKKLGRISLEIQQSSGAADRVFEILDSEITVVESPDAVPVSDSLQKMEFRDVAFNYGEKTVFDKLNLTINAGESLAIVGPSGGGKTTLVNLMLRFFDPTSGEVLRNGKNIKDLTFSSLRSNIGLVLQDTFLFNASIADNIAYGKADATREEIIEAAKLAHAHDFIMAKENGYDTIVGERGVSLSGGQKQRLAIARALIRKPELLLLDEATSALDTDSERAVQAAIDELMEKLTVVVIAHRLSTVAKCKHIAVVSGGGVSEYGTREELLKNKEGVFSHLYNLQFERPFG